MHGCELLQLVSLLLVEDGDTADTNFIVPRGNRMEQLKAFLAEQH